MTRLLVLLFCISMATTQRNGNFIKDRGSTDELREIQRQNKITAQILENFLERRLYPHKRPTHRLPTIDEILPKTTERPPRSAVNQSTPEEDIENDNQEVYDVDQDPESLQSVESEHVDSYYQDNVGYRNNNAGRF